MRSLAPRLNRMYRGSPCFKEAHCSSTHVGAAAPIARKGQRFVRLLQSMHGTVSLKKAFVVIAKLGIMSVWDPSSQPQRAVSFILSRGLGLRQWVRRRIVGSDQPTLHLGVSGKTIRV